MTRRTRPADHFSLAGSSPRTMPTVREATDADREAIAAVQEAAIREFGPDAYPEEAVAAWASYPEPGVYDLDDPDDAFVVAAVDGECEPPGGVAGFAELLVPDAEVSKMYVHPDSARRGVGRALVEWAVAAARERGLDALTLEASLNAAGFYERVGFEPVDSHEKTLSHEGETVPMRVVDMRRRL